MRRLAIGRSIPDVLGLTVPVALSVWSDAPWIQVSRHHIEVTSFGGTGAVYLPEPAWDVSLRVAEFDINRFGDFYAIDVTVGTRRYCGTMWVRDAQQTVTDGASWWTLHGESQDLTVAPLS